MGDRGIARGATASLAGRAIRLDARVASNPWHPGRGSYSTSLETAAALLVLSACVLGGCGEGTRPAPPAAGPPIAARSFNSKMYFLVWVMREEGGESQGIGKTPAAKPIEIPACWAWGVSPLGAPDMRAVAQEMAAQNIPGLRMNYAKDEDLAYLADVKGLQWLNIRCSLVTDAGLAHLKKLKGLQRLNFYYTQRITDAGLAHLKDLKGLQMLSLSVTQVTDAGFVHLKELKGLRRLDLSNTKVTDAGLVHLKDLKGLQTLELRNAKVADAGLVHLAELKGLQTLNLSFTQVTDAGLVHLKELKGLQMLDLTGARVTDAGLIHLKELKGLQVLGLYKTQVTEAGVEEFERAMPNVKVEH